MNEVSEHEDAVMGSEEEEDEEDETDQLDFNARLTMSREDRRSFWMVKEKSKTKKTKKHKPKPQGV